MGTPFLEVIATCPADAIAAQAGGARRLEVVTCMAADGLTPDSRTVAEIRAACALPLRVMLRPPDGFQLVAGELEDLCGQAGELAAAGAHGFVFGFLDAAGEVDVASVTALAEVIAPLPWTFHRAIDHAADPDRAWRAVRGIPGLDAVLTAGSAGGVTEGAAALEARAAADHELILAGGGLRQCQLPRLRRAGVTRFHVGSSARPNGSFGDGVDAGLVAGWVAAIAAAGQ